MFFVFYLFCFAYFLITHSVCSILIFFIETQFNINTLYTNFSVFFFFYYYIITPSICSILISVIETRFNINTLYTNYFSYRQTMSCASEFRRYLFTLFILFICLFLFCLDFVLFHEALLLLRCLIASLLNWLTWVVISKSSQSYIYFKVIYYPFLNIFCRNVRENCFTHLVFPNFSFICFHWKITWKITRQSKQES